MGPFLYARESNKNLIVSTVAGLQLIYYATDVSNCQSELILKVIQGHLRTVMSSR